MSDNDTAIFEIFDGELENWLDALGTEFAEVSDDWFEAFHEKVADLEPGKVVLFDFGTEVVLKLEATRSEEGDYEIKFSGPVSELERLVEVEAILDGDDAEGDFDEDEDEDADDAAPVSG